MANSSQYVNELYRSTRPRQDETKAPFSWNYTKFQLATFCKKKKITHFEKKPLRSRFTQFRPSRLVAGFAVAGHICTYIENILILKRANNLWCPNAAYEYREMAWVNPWLIRPDKQHGCKDDQCWFILIIILNEGGGWAEIRACGCALNLMLIGMYKENLCEIVLTQGLILPDFCVHKVLVRNPLKS